MNGRLSQLTRRTVAGLFWVVWGAGARAVLSLLVVATLARLLSPLDFGLVAAALVVVKFSKLFSELGLGPALVQRRELEPRHVETAFVTSIVFGVVFGITVWALAPAVAQVLRIDALAPVLRALAALFPILGFGLVPEFLLKRELQFKWLANREVATYLLAYAGVGIPLAALGFGVWALVAAQLAASTLNVALMLLRHPPPKRWRFDARAFRELMYFGGGHTLAKLGTFVAQEGDNLVVGRWLGAEALGLYGRSYKLMATSSSLVGGALDKVLFPVMARVQDDEKRLGTAYLRGVALITLVMLPTSTLLLMVAPELIQVLLGPQWMGVVAPFRIFAAGIILRSSFRMSDSIARATGFVYQRALRQWLYALLVLIGAAIGQQWGVSGVAFGVLGALAVNFVLMAQLSLRVAALSWRRFASAHRPAFCLTAATLPVAWGAVMMGRAQGLPPALTLLAAALAVGLCAGLLGLTAPRAFLGPDGVWALDVLRHYLPARFQRARGDAVVSAPAPPAEPRVAFFLPSMVGGGAERVMLNVARGLADRGLGVDMVLATASGPYLSQIPPAVRVVDLGARGVLGSLPALVRYLRRDRPDVLVTASTHGSVVGLCARRAARVSTRTCVTVHNPRSSQARRARLQRARLLPYLMRWCYPWADSIVAVSQAAADDVARTTGIARERIHVIPNPVVTPDVLQRAQDCPAHPWFRHDGAPVILGVGRLTWHKDFPTLLKAFALVRQRRPTRLLILGEGPERSRLEAMARDLHLEGDIELPGFVSNPYAFMARCGVFVLSSVTEGLPTVLIEALAAGAPVVSTECRSGPREILRNGQLGRLVPVGDAVALAEGIGAALDQPRGAVAPEAWESFTLEAAVNRYQHVLGVGNHA